MPIRWKRMCCAVLLAVALTGIAGCGFHETPAMSDDAIRQALLDKTWTLEKVVAREVESELPMTLKFGADGTVTGFGGCNAFKGKYTLSGDKLNFGPLDSTHTSCGPAMDEQEFTFLTLLARIQVVKIEGDELTLVTDNQGEVVLTSGQSGLFW